jgi:hypothetical protein
MRAWMLHLKSFKWLHHFFTVVRLQTVKRLDTNQKRRQLLFWLRDPVAHFRLQVDGDLVKDGV